MISGFHQGSPNRPGLEVMSKVKNWHFYWEYFYDKIFIWTLIIRQKYVSFLEEKSQKAQKISDASNVSNFSKVSNSQNQEKTMKVRICQVWILSSASEASLFWRHKLLWSIFESRITLLTPCCQKLCLFTPSLDRKFVPYICLWFLVHCLCIRLCKWGSGAFLVKS